jgi:hypothetical protein
MVEYERAESLLSPQDQGPEAASAFAGLAEAEVIALAVHGCRPVRHDEAR